MVLTAGTGPVVGAGGNGGMTRRMGKRWRRFKFYGIISKGGGGAPGWRATNGRAGGSGSGSTGQVAIIQDQVRIVRSNGGTGQLVISPRWWRWCRRIRRKCT